MVLDTLYYTHSIYVDKLINDILFESIEKSFNNEIDIELKEIINNNELDIKYIKYIKKLFEYIVLFDFNKGLKYNVNKLIYKEFNIFNILRVLHVNEYINNDMYMGIMKDELNNDTLKYMTILPILDYLLNNVVNVDNVKEVKRIMNRLRNIYRLRNMNNNDDDCLICNNKLINVKIMNNNKICHYCYYTCI